MRGYVISTAARPFGVRPGTIDCGGTTQHAIPLGGTQADHMQARVTEWSAAARARAVVTVYWAVKEPPECP